MIGMGVLSLVIAVPLAFSARFLTVANRALQGAVGVVTIAIGLVTLVETVLLAHRPRWTPVFGPSAGSTRACSSRVPRVNIP